MLGSTTTGVTGSFAVAYTPPSTATVLYLVALGGSATGGSGSNPAIGLMGVVGMSNALPASVTINELTTVAAQWALAQFIDSTGQIIGAPSSNATGFANAVTQAQVNLADISTGLPAGFWSNQGATATGCTVGSPPVNCNGLERMDTIANILAACVESSGSSSSACGTVLTDTGGTTTLEAAHVMATDPTANVATLFALQSGSPPFTPALSAAPDGFEIALNFAPSGANFNFPYGLAIDAAGNVWVGNFKGNSVTELTSSGGLAGYFTPSGANFNAPVGVAIDAADNVWVTNGGFPSSAIGNDGSVSELLAGCSSSSCTGLNFDPSGADFDKPVGVAIAATGNVWVPNSLGNSVIELRAGCSNSSCTVYEFAPTRAKFDVPQFVAIGAAGNVWVTNEGGDSVTELTSSGDLAGIGNFNNTNLSGANFAVPVGVAIDVAGDIWVANAAGNSVTELTSNSTARNFAPSGPGGASFNTPYGLAIDAAGNVWATNSNGSVTELTPNSGLAANFALSSAYFDVPYGLAIDAAGNVWVPNYDNNSVAEIVGAARPVLTPLVACLTHSPPAAVCLP